MSEPEKRSRLAEWGSRPMSGRDRVLVWTGVLLVAAVVSAIVVIAGRDTRDDYSTLEKQLNERYEESVSIRVATTQRSTRETIILDGVERLDCDATEDGYLECEDDPQPTPVDE